MPLALLALTISAFGIGTTEFIIMGLLPEVAGDFDVSVPTAGLLVSGYALAVAVSAPILTAATIRLRRKHLLLGLLVLFVVGNLLCAAAPSYPALMAGRIVTALCHGAFFGVGSVVAADLVRPDRRARAVALMFTGLTVANVIGVPAGTLLAGRFGWRAAFVAVAALGAVSLAGVAVLVPARSTAAATGLRAELGAFRRPQVWLALAITAIGFGGIFASFTYVAPMMTALAGYPASAVSWLFILFGAGLVVGNLAGGRAADRAPTATVLVLFGALTLVLAAFAVTAHHAVAAALTLFALGAVGFGTVPPLQARVMREASGAPTLASAANIAGFNLGNALGAWLGGLAIDAGYGYASTNVVGAAMAAVGLLIAVAAALLGRRTAGPIGVPGGVAVEAAGASAGAAAEAAGASAGAAAEAAGASVRSTAGG